MIFKGRNRKINLSLKENKGFMTTAASFDILVPNAYSNGEPKKLIGNDPRRFVYQKNF